MNTLHVRHAAQGPGEASLTFTTAPWNGFHYCLAAHLTQPPREALNCKPLALTRTPLNKETPPRKLRGPSLLSHRSKDAS